MADTLMAKRIGSRPRVDRIRRIRDRLEKRGLMAYVLGACRDHHVTADELLGDRKRKHEAAARNQLWRALHDDAGLSWIAVAELFEKKHDGVIHAGSHRESRARELLESGVAEQVAKYVEGFGYEVLAAEIRAGAWRPVRDGRRARVLGSPACPEPKATTTMTSPSTPSRRFANGASIEAPVGSAIPTTLET